MGSKQYHRWRVTFSISEEAYEKLNEVVGNRSSWIEQLILGSPVPEEGKVETFRMANLERRVSIMEQALIDSPVALSDQDPPDPEDQEDHEEECRTILQEGGRGELGRRRAADPVFREEVVKRFEAGVAISRIMKDLRTGYPTVMRILEEHGLN